MAELSHGSNKLRVDSSSDPVLLEELVGAGLSNQVLKGLSEMTAVTSDHGANSSLPISHVRRDFKKSASSSSVNISGLPHLNVCVLCNVPLGRIYSSQKCCHCLTREASRNVILKA